MRLQSTNQKRIRLFWILLLIICLAMCTTTVAFADKIQTGAIDEGGGKGFVRVLFPDDAGWGDTWDTVLLAARNIGLVLGAASLALGGIMIVVPAFVGSGDAEKSIGIGKSIIKTTLVALLCLILLPYVLKFGYTLVKGNIFPAWEPPEGVPPYEVGTPDASPSPTPTFGMRTVNFGNDWGL